MRHTGSPTANLYYTATPFPDQEFGNRIRKGPKKIISHTAYCLMPKESKKKVPSLRHSPMGAQDDSVRNFRRSTGRKEGNDLDRIEEEEPEFLPKSLDLKIKAQAKLQRREMDEIQIDSNNLIPFADVADSDDDENEENNEDHVIYQIIKGHHA